MEEKFISKEVFEAKIGILEERIHNLSDKLDTISDQLTVISEVVKTLTAHEKDIESIRRETERNKLRIEQLESKNAKIIWAIGGTILAAIVQFVINGGLIIKK